jgi:hypothetical protein
MSFLQPVPRPVRCKCDDPECLGWLVDNINTREGRFNLVDAKIIANRHNLLAMVKAFQGYLVRTGADGRERQLFQDLVKLQSDCRDGL